MFLCLFDAAGELICGKPDFHFIYTQLSVSLAKKVKTSSHKTFSISSIFPRIPPNTKSDFEIACENSNAKMQWR